MHPNESTVKHYLPNIPRILFFTIHSLRMTKVSSFVLLFSPLLLLFSYKIVLHLLYVLCQVLLVSGEWGSFILFWMELNVECVYVLLKVDLLCDVSTKCILMNFYYNAIHFFSLELTC